MDMKNVGLYLLIWVYVFLLVKAQVEFDPDPEEDLQLQTTPSEAVNVTTVQCYSDSPKFKVKYVALNDKTVEYDIEIGTVSSNDGFPIHDNRCASNAEKYRVILNSLKFITDAALVGKTFKIKVTLDKNDGNSTLSRRTYTFPAPFNLTGSSGSAVLYFNYTWTCLVTSNNSTIEWYRGIERLGQSGILNGNCKVTPTPNDTYMYSCQQTNKTYTLTIPGFSLTEDLQSTQWRCRDVNSEVKGSKFMELDIFYPPKVVLYLQNATENTTNHIIRCRAEGRPNNATIIALQQRIGSTFIRNITSFTELSPGNITLTIPRVSYQDMGTYTCLASNGIPDRSNQKIQSDTAYLNVNTSAKFKTMQYSERSDINTKAVVSIPFYRNPPATESDVVWTNKTGTSDEPMESSVNVSLSLSDVIVHQTIHGVDAILKGQSAIMTISSFQNYHEGNYSLEIRSSHGDSLKVTIVLKRSGPPDSPSEFQLLTREVNSVVLTWNKGSNGGHPQTFVIFYKETISGVYTRKQLNDTTMDNNITDEVKNLKPDTSYVFLLYSFNEKGNSSGYQTLEEKTLKAPVVSAPSSLNSGLVGGAAGGGVAVLVVIIVIIVVVRRRRHQEGEGKDYNSRETLAGPPKGNDDNEDGLKDNPLYGGNPCGANAVQGTSKSPDNPSLYAEVAKPKKKSPAKVIEVDKSSKKNAKGKQKKQNAKDTAGGEQNQNMDGFKQTGSTEQKAKENKLRGYKNKDGLFYMDVKFDQPPARGKPTIRKEEPTGYAMIQFEEPNAKPTPNNARDAEGGQ